MTTAIAGTPARLVPPLLIGVVVLLGAVGPLATDMYVPAFPLVTKNINASAGEVQLTLTSFFVGMGLGQVIGGPVSDQVGRRRPLMVGTLLTVAASVACAMAPNFGVLFAARLLQGFGGGWSMVIGRSVIVDLAAGPQLVKVMNMLMGVGSVAPIVAPLLGAVLLRFTHTWRAAFWTIAGLAVLMTVAALLVVPESLPPEKRRGGGLRAFLGNAREVLANRRFVGYMLVNAFTFLALFAYVASSAFVLQNMGGLSPLQYSVDFAFNAFGMMLATMISARLAGRVATRRVIFFGQCIALLGAVVMTIAATAFGMPLLVAMVCFAVLMSAQGYIGPNGAALAAGEVPHLAGTASAVLGLTMSVAASIAPPIAGLGGTHSAVPTALLMLTGAIGSMLCLLVLARPKAGEKLL